MSSGFSYPQPMFTSPIYNPAFYLRVDASGYLTYDYAQTLYLDKNDYRLTYITGITPGTATQGIALVPGTNNDISGIEALSCSSLTVNGSTVSSAPSYVVSITPGTAAINKALVLGASGEIGTISSLTATSITGTLQTAAQTNITSLGTLSGLTIAGNLVFTGASRSVSGLSSISATTLAETLATAAQSNITSVGTLSSLTVSGSITGTLATAAQSNIASVGTLSSLTVSGSITGTLAPAAQSNIASVGTLSSLTVSGSITGTLATAAQSNITSVGTLSSLTVSGSITGTLATAAQTNITSVGTLTSLTLSTEGTGLQIPNIKFWNSTLSSYLNFDHLAFIGFSYGGAVPQKALVVDINKDIGSIRTIDAQNLNGSIKISGTLCDVGSIQISGTDIITSSRHIQNIGNITCSGNMNAFSGIQINSVDFVDTSRNISAASLSMTGDISCTGSINGFLAYGNQANITTVGSLTELGINSTPTNEYLSITGSGSGFIDGSYTRMCMFAGSNITPVKFQLLVSNGSSATSTNSTWIGNYTSNDLRFGTNQTTQMVLTTTGRLGVGTTTPSAPLHIPNTISYQFGSGGSTVYRLQTNSGVTESALGPILYNVSAVFGGYLACTALATTSDRRLKRNIQAAPLDRIKILYEQCGVKLYEWIESEHRPGQEVGLIAQDLARAHLMDLCSVYYRDDIEQGEDPSLEPAHTQLNIDYSRISAYNMRMIQHLMSEIDDLKSQLNELRAIIAE